MAQDEEGLTHAILIDGEVLFGETIDRPGFTVADAGMQDDVIHLDGDQEPGVGLRIEAEGRAEEEGRRECAEMCGAHDASILRYSGCHMPSLTCCTMSLK